MPSLSLSWIAVKGLAKEPVLSALGLVEADPDTKPLYAKLQLADLPSGWIIILAADFNDPTPARLALVSAGGMALACSIDERVMYSVARLYEDGQAVWSVAHNGGDKGVYHLDVAGAPRAELVQFKARITSEQDTEGGDAAGVDVMFDLPPELSQAICGYQRSDESV